MSSEAQRKKGYPLPADEFTEETQSFCITIPAGLEYEMAMRGQLRELGTWWKWKRSEDRPNAASDAAVTWRSLLLINQDCGGSMATQEDIAKGMYQAMNWLALQIASGSYQNVVLSTDEDGVVSIPSGDTAPPPVEDDPETIIDETKASKAGGAIGIRLGFNEIWTIVATMYTASPTSQEACTTRLLDTYTWVSDAECGAFVNDYYAARAGAASWIAAFTTVLDSRMYCKGISKQWLNDWIYDTFTGSQLDMALDLSRAIADEQIAFWFAYGSQTPSSAFLGYSCHPANVEIFTLDMSSSNNPQYTTNAVYKVNHRLLIEVSGSFVDTDVSNTIQDFYYTVNTATGAKTFLPSMFAINGAGIVEPVQAAVPYEPSHEYAITLDTQAAGAIVFGRDNDTYTIPNVTGILSFRVTDLGEFTY